MQEPAERAPQKEAADYILRLYVTGSTPNSARAINNIREVCNEHLAGRYALEVIDVYQQPDLARQQQLVALPMLVIQSPLPERRLVGDMSVEAKVLKALGIQ